MKTNETNYAVYVESLDDNDRQLLNNFFASFAQHMALPRKSSLKIKNDFENAIAYYASIGLPLNESLALLDPANLGGFYARPASLWYELDDAAKIYPLSLKHGEMAVFRMSMYFKTDVNPILLQMALTFTIKRFPRFATTLKKGIFWHYLDTTKRRYQIEAENDLPCRPLKVSQSGSQSFRVLYYRNRLSVEFFHVLTDGTGGMIFLKTLSGEYLRLLNVKVPRTHGVLDTIETPAFEEDINEFAKVPRKQKASGFLSKAALQMSGKISHYKPNQIIHFKMSAADLKDVAKTYGVTVTTFLLGLFFLATKYSTDARKGDLAIQVPVNMRRFHSSNTLSNFTMYAGIRIPISQVNELPMLLENINEQMNSKATKEKMSEMMYSAHKMTRSLNFIPLFLKSPIAKIAYGFLGEKVFTTTFSNLGVVTLPEVYNDYIESLDFLLGPPQLNRCVLALVTFNDVATLSITKITKDPSFVEELLRLLENHGLHPIIEGSEIYEYKFNLSAKKTEKNSKKKSN